MELFASIASCLGTNQVWEGEGKLLALFALKNLTTGRRLWIGLKNMNYHGESAMIAEGLKSVMENRQESVYNQLNKAANQQTINNQKKSSTNN